MCESKWVPFMLCCHQPLVSLVINKLVTISNCHMLRNMWKIDVLQGNTKLFSCCVRSTLTCEEERMHEHICLTLYLPLTSNIEKMHSLIDFTKCLIMKPFRKWRICHSSCFIDVCVCVNTQYTLLTFKNYMIRFSISMSESRISM